jgi:hypothetical protein
LRENEIYINEGLENEINQDESSMVLKLGIFGDQKINKYMKYKEFLKKQELTELFNLNNEVMVQYIKDRLLRLKPKEDGDIAGWVYVYYR